MTATHHAATFLAIVCSLLALASCTSSARQPETPPHSAAAAAVERIPDVVLSCPGRIEGAGENIEVGAQMDGVVRTILVAEGQQVKKGMKIAEMHCPELPAELAEAEAEVERRLQSKARIVRGSRDEERMGAEQRVAAAKAVLEEAKTHLKRMKYLVGHGALAQNQLDAALRDHDVAAARLHEAMRNEELVKAAALPEDLAKADAEIAAAEQRVDLVKRRIYKCGVGAPADGTVLRVHLKPGESFSMVNPKPILTIADLSVRRVRAEIDERDISKVHVGQPVTVRQEGLRGASYGGRVTMIYQTMGRKRIRTGDPSEKADRDILEAMIDLDEAAYALPVGLRVVVRFEGRPAQAMR